MTPDPAALAADLARELSDRAIDRRGRALLYGNVWRVAVAERLIADALRPLLERPRVYTVHRCDGGRVDGAAVGWALVRKAGA